MPLQDLMFLNFQKNNMSSVMGTLSTPKAHIRTYFSIIDHPSFSRNFTAKYIGKTG